MAMTIICGTARPERGDGPCEGLVAFEVVVRNSDRSKVLSRTLSCFKHGLAETERAAKAGGVAHADLEPLPAPAPADPYDHKVFRSENPDGPQRLMAPADHPHTDPGDGRSECATCGKWVWPATHSCKGVRVAPAPADPQGGAT